VKVTATRVRSRLRIVKEVEDIPPVGSVVILEEVITEPDRFVELCAPLDLDAWDRKRVPQLYRVSDGAGEDWVVEPEWVAAEG